MKKVQIKTETPSLDEDSILEEEVVVVQKKDKKAKKSRSKEPKSPLSPVSDPISSRKDKSPKKAKKSKREDSSANRDTSEMRASLESSPKKKKKDKKSSSKKDKKKKSPSPPVSENEFEDRVGYLAETPTMMKRGASKKSPDSYKS